MVSGALWRKKVDGSLFEYTVTTLPNWICTQWKVPVIFRSSSRKTDQSKVEIRFKGRSYEGWVTIARKGRSSPAYRLWFTEELLQELKNTFLMSYMRHLEAKLRAHSNSHIGGDVEDEIPFWEFIDIEFNGARGFAFTAHYKQKPLFPLLFRQLQGTPVLAQTEDYLKRDLRLRIYKQPWRQRKEMLALVEQRNVIYYLADKKKRLFYVGEADKLIGRLRQGHPIISTWTHFRFDVLPLEFSNHRKTLERAAIRSFASIMKNTRGVDVISISGWRLVNRYVGHT